MATDNTRDHAFAEERSEDIAKLPAEGLGFVIVTLLPSLGWVAGTFGAILGDAPAWAVQLCLMLAAANSVLTLAIGLMARSRVVPALPARQLRRSVGGAIVLVAVSAR